jgi:hypothetical protein
VSEAEYNELREQLDKVKADLKAQSREMREQTAALEKVMVPLLLCRGDFCLVFLLAPPAIDGPFRRKLSARSCKRSWTWLRTS